MCRALVSEAAYQFGLFAPAVLLDPDRIAAITGERKRVALRRVAGIEIAETVFLSVRLGLTAWIGGIGARWIVVQSREIAKGFALGKIVLWVCRTSIDLAGRYSDGPRSQSQCNRCETHMLRHNNTPCC